MIVKLLYDIYTYDKHVIIEFFQQKYILVNYVFGIKFGLKVSAKLFQKPKSNKKLIKNLSKALVLGS